MTTEQMNNLIERGFADEARVAADAVYEGKPCLLAVSGEVVSLISFDMQKIMSDSIDTLKDLTVKSGLFKKSISFTYHGAEYDITIKGGKTLLQYFKLLAAE